MEGGYNQPQVNYSGSGITGHEVGYSDAANKSDVFKGDVYVVNLYNSDNQSINAGEWYFDPDAYTDAIDSVNDISGSLCDISSAIGAINVSLKSPEGKELESGVNGSIKAMSGNINGLSSGVWYCGKWATHRLEKGVSANKLTEEVAEKLPQLDDFKDISKRIVFGAGDTVVSFSELIGEYGEAINKDGVYGFAKMFLADVHNAYISVWRGAFGAVEVVADSATMLVLDLGGDNISYEDKVRALDSVRLEMANEAFKDGYDPNGSSFFQSNGLGSNTISGVTTAGAATITVSLCGGGALAGVLTGATVGGASSAQAYLNDHPNNPDNIDETVTGACDAYEAGAIGGGITGYLGVALPETATFAQTTVVNTLDNSVQSYASRYAETGNPVDGLVQVVFDLPANVIAGATQTTTEGATDNYGFDPVDIGHTGDVA